MKTVDIPCTRIQNFEIVSYFVSISVSVGDDLLLLPFISILFARIFNLTVAAVLCFPEPFGCTRIKNMVASRPGSVQMLLLHSETTICDRSDLLIN